MTSETNAYATQLSPFRENVLFASHTNWMMFVASSGNTTSTNKFVGCCVVPNLFHGLPKCQTQRRLSLVVKKKSAAHCPSCKALVNATPREEMHIFEYRIECTSIRSLLNSRLDRRSTDASDSKPGTVDTTIMYENEKQRTTVREGLLFY